MSINPEHVLARDASRSFTRSCSRAWQRGVLLGACVMLPTLALAQTQAETQAQPLPPGTSSPGVADLRGVVEQAIRTSPEVQAAWDGLNAAGHDIDVVKGGYFPQVDVLAGAGIQDRQYDGQGSYDTDQVELTLKQMLYDGFATRSQVEKHDRAELVRYYELLGASENTALEVTRAYLDVQRYRELVRLAQDNYQRHRRVQGQIDERTRSGAGRGVDLDQINGRLALAESNLLTEASNLHDVSARYQRLVGELPAASLAPVPTLDAQLPIDVSQALSLAYEGNPEFHAAIENIAALRAEQDIAKAGYHPRLDLVGRTGSYRGSTSSGDYIEGSDRQSRSSIELVASMNLYRGGSDQASFRAASARVEQADSLRRKACVDVRQTTQIAYNDSQRLRDQLSYLDRHRQSSDQVRKAYRQQFDIGQRTLLDLLDIENEYFEASRAYTSARYDVALADVRTLASMGQLLQALEVRRDDLPSLADLGSDGVTLDAETLCPAVGARQYRMDELTAR
jgi:adhesin transport system outer membrane protein